MRKRIGKFLLQYQKDNRKRFDLHILEDYLIKSYSSSRAYLEEGGYNEFYNQIIQLKENNHIKEIKSSTYNGFNPPLKTRWEIVVKQTSPRWDAPSILKYSDHLDFTYYQNNPIYQTDLEWEYIENIYRFLQSKESRQWVSIEERSLELFYHEKFITSRKDRSKGRYGILKRLKLTEEDLKIKKYGEMFIYWNRGVKNIQKIIILENHSTFFTYKRIMEGYGNILGFAADALIYGAGKKIENSFAFIEELTDLSDVEILYFGDVDSEGFGIYDRLKTRYPKVNIKLHQKAYMHLISICHRDYPLGGQKKNQIYFDNFIEEMKDELTQEHLEKLKDIWDKDFRIPQELISYEYLAKVIT